MRRSGLGIAQVIEEVIAGRRFDFSVERALFAMVANRACAPAPKLYCFSQWLAEDVRIAGTERLELQHLYRAMDCLEAEKAAIERAIDFRVADLLSLDVDLLFYDTTSVLLTRSMTRTAGWGRTMSCGEPRQPGPNST